MNDFSYTVKTEATKNHSAIKLLTVTALQPVAGPLMFSFSLVLHFLQHQFLFFTYTITIIGPLKTSDTSIVQWL